MGIRDGAKESCGTLLPYCGELGVVIPADKECVADACRTRLTMPDIGVEVGRPVLGAGMPFEEPLGIAPSTPVAMRCRVVDTVADRAWPNADRVQMGRGDDEGDDFDDDDDDDDDEDDDDDDLDDFDEDDDVDEFDDGDEDDGEVDV